MRSVDTESGGGGAAAAEKVSADAAAAARKAAEDASVPATEAKVLPTPLGSVGLPLAVVLPVAAVEEEAGRRGRGALAITSGLKVHACGHCRLRREHSSRHPS